MTPEEFRKFAHQAVDWMATYLEDLGSMPVKPAIRPGDIKTQLPLSAPVYQESFEQVMADFKAIIVPGMTHWQHPGFMAYFPTGASGPSVLAEMLTSVMGAQCMVWLTSPAAEELEERMMEWLRDLLGLPSMFTGVIQDSSSSSTLVSLLTAREFHSGYTVNRQGFTGNKKFRVYTSSQAHSSVDKGVKIAGFGIENLIKIDADAAFAMIPEALETAILKDIAEGLTPLCVVSTVGTTSSTAIDPIESIGRICKQYNCWHHIDASYAGTALLLPEMRFMSKGVELADSFVVNPHKWMLTNFDCSAYYVRDKNALINTFSILPEYLKTTEDKLVNNYRDWGIPLGRRFRALKLWFVMRMYGQEGMQEIIRRHIALGQWLATEITKTPGFEIMAPVPLNLICFRLHPKGCVHEAELDKINQELLEKLNSSGKILLTQTRLNGKFVIRFVSGQENIQKEDIVNAWELIKYYAKAYLKA